MKNIKEENWIVLPSDLKSQLVDMTQTADHAVKTLNKYELAKELESPNLDQIKAELYTAFSALEDFSFVQ